MSLVLYNQYTSLKLAGRCSATDHSSLEGSHWWKMGQVIELEGVHWLKERSERGLIGWRKGVPCTEQ